MRSETIDWAAYIEPVARRLCGEPNKALSNGIELRFGTNGSLRVSIGGPTKGTWRDHENKVSGGVLALIQHKLGLSNGDAIDWFKSNLHADMADKKPAPEAKPASPQRVVATYRYHDEQGSVLYRVLRWGPQKTFVQNPPDGKGGWIVGKGCMTGVRRVPYWLNEWVWHPDRPLLVPEGEKDVDRLRSLGLLATCNVGGAGNWLPEDKENAAEFIAHFRGRAIIVLPDNDEAGRNHRDDIVRSLLPVAAEIKVVELPGLPPKGDVSDWLDAGGDRDALLALVEAAVPVREMPAAEPARNVVPLRPVRNQKDGPPEGPPDGRGLPIIKIRGGDLSDIVDQVNDLLAVHDTEIFQRGGILVHPALEPIDIRNGLKTLSWRLVEVDRIHLADRLTRIIDFQQFNKTQNLWLSVDCPEKVARTYLARKGDWKVPIISGITDAPTLRPDGSVIETPGYDHITGLLYKPSCDYEALLPSLTKAHASAALTALCKLLVGFPFVGEDGSVVPNTPSASRSVALSFLLTACSRYAFARAPLHGFDAPAAGSGKSLLVDCASMIATGHEAAVMGQGESSEEFEKCLGAALLAGDPMISFDNAESPIGGPLLCRCLTQPRVKVRILGRSEQPTIPCGMLFSATGNNLVIKGDVTRRAIVARLDPKVERPEEREFDVDLMSSIRENRPFYVRACLTILRAFVLSEDSRKSSKPLGSYEEWSGLVRDALIWLDQPDPVLTMEKVRKTDPILTALADVLTQWVSVAADAGFSEVTAKRLIDHAATTERVERTVDGEAQSHYELKYPDLRDALVAVAGDQRGNISSVTFGKWLAKNKGRVVNKLVIDNGLEKASGGVVRWKVSRVG